MPSSARNVTPRTAFDGAEPLLQPADLRSRLSRAGVGREERRAAQALEAGAVERVHARVRVELADQLRARSPASSVMCPAPGTTKWRDRGKCFATSSPQDEGVTGSFSPEKISVGTFDATGA